MFWTVFLLVAAASIQLSATEEDKPGSLVKFHRTVAPLVGFEKTCKPTGHYVQCESCTSYMVCLAGLKSNRTCPTNKPYCNNNECSAKRDYKSCPVPSLNCTGVGFYPDPKACQFYHYCLKIGMASDVYKCPQNYYFNPQNSLCRKESNESRAVCGTIDCDSDKILQTYGSSNKYFGFCRDTDILMAKCADFHVFTGTGCVFQCPSEGLFPHADPTRYFFCFYVEQSLIAQEIGCPPDRVFDYFKGVCLAPPDLELSNEPHA